MKYLIVFLLLILSVVSQAQVTPINPNTFPSETNPNNSNFEFYSQKTGTPKKASFDDVRKNMLPVIATQSTVTTSGNTTNLGNFVTDSQGQIWYVQPNGAAIKISRNDEVTLSTSIPSSAPLSGAPRLWIRTTTGAMYVWSGSAWVQSLTTGTALGGDLSGTVTNAQIVAGSVGSSELSNFGAMTGQLLKWSGTAWVAADDDMGASTLGGDLSGDISNAQINAGVVTGVEIGQMGAASGYVLKWNGTTWLPSADIGGASIYSGSGIVPTGVVATITDSLIIGGVTITDTTLLAAAIAIGSGLPPKEILHLSADFSPNIRLSESGDTYDFMNGGLEWWAGNDDFRGGRVGMNSGNLEVSNYNTDRFLKFRTNGQVRAEFSPRGDFMLYQNLVLFEPDFDTLTGGSRPLMYDPTTQKVVQGEAGGGGSAVLNQMATDEGTTTVAQDGWRTGQMMLGQGARDSVFTVANNFIRVVADGGANTGLIHVRNNTGTANIGFADGTTEKVCYIGQVGESFQIRQYTDLKFKMDFDVVDNAFNLTNQTTGLYTKAGRLRLAAYDSDNNDAMPASAGANYLTFDNAGNVFMARGDTQNKLLSALPEYNSMEDAITALGSGASFRVGPSAYFAQRGAVIVTP